VAPDADALARGWPELWSFSFLIGLTLLYYWKMAFTGLVLGGYDTQTYFYPYRHAAAEAITHGRLPLWNPSLFLGAPFMANIQTAVFYPLNVVFYLLPTAYAMNVSVILHIVLAGSYMYAWCRFSLRLDQIGAAGGAVAFMFSGFMSAQVGHINQINVAAWLPCLLLCFDRATTRRPAFWTAAGAVVIATQFFAGHSQESYLLLFVFGLYVLFRLVWGGSGKARAASRITTLGTGVGMVVLGIGLAAIQLLPTLELAGESIRAGGMSYPEAVSF
jgi:hypothetical protein